jgi:pimeloyl-ACP methyl ester carboxylesterase
MKPGEKRPAVMVLHGFGNNKDSANSINPCDLFTRWGYVTFRFDFRGCGESQGERGMVICMEQVEDTSAALEYLSTRAEIDASRIGVVGSSFGGAVAIYAAGVDKRIAAVMSSGGWGHGEQKFRLQHPTREAWAKFTAMLEEGRRHRQRTGKSLMVDRYDIVPIPPHLRKHLNPTAHYQFPAEVAQSMYNFNAEDVVADIAPRPLLLLHSSTDSVTPTEQSVRLFQRAGKNCDLHLFAETDHFMFHESNQRVMAVVRTWLESFFPVQAAKETAAA